MNVTQTSTLPARHSLTIAAVVSLLITLLTAVASVAGLVAQDSIYPTETLRRAYLTNDIANLVIGLPILLLAMWLAWRGLLVGLLLWPGAMVYGLYNYLIYLFGMPYNWLFPLYLAIVALSLYGTTALLVNIDGALVKQRLSGRVPERFAGGIVAVFGLLFLVLAITELIDPLTNEAEIARPDLALAVADVILSIALVIGGVSLWRRQALGYVSGLGLLFLATTLFAGLILVLAIQPLLSDAPFAATDILVTLVMSLVAVVPFVRYLRGVISS